MDRLVEANAPLKSAIERLNELIDAAETLLTAAALSLGQFLSRVLTELVVVPAGRYDFLDTVRGHRIVDGDNVTSKDQRTGVRPAARRREAVRLPRPWPRCTAARSFERVRFARAGGRLHGGSPFVGVMCAPVSAAVQGIGRRDRASQLTGDSAGRRRISASASGRCRSRPGPALRVRAEIVTRCAATGLGTAS